MNEQEMFERSFQRPRDFFSLPKSAQWEIDKQLGILDWKGRNLTEIEQKRFEQHYVD